MFSMKDTFGNIRNNLPTGIFKYGIVAVSMCIFFYVLYLASNDPTAIFQTSYIYIFLLLIPIGAIFFLINDTMETMTILYVVGALFAIALIYIGYNSKILNVMFAGYLYYVFVLIITILALAIIYNVAINNLQKQPGLTGFIVNLIFYIPCLVSDAIQYLIDDYKSTSQIVFILFIMEIAVLLIYFYILPYFENLLKTDGIVIQGDPVFLNKTTVIPETVIQPLSLVKIIINTDENPDISTGSWMYNSIGLKNDVYDKYNDEGNVRKNFTISLWCYLNPPTTSRIAPNMTGKTPAQDKGKNSIYGANIFYYGTPSSMDMNMLDKTNNAPPFLDLSGGSYHPRLAYYVDLSDSYYVIDTNTDSSYDEQSRFELRLPMQRWNNFVFNYNANTVDIFINGTLERTVKSIDPIHFQYNSDIMVIGSNPVTYMGDMSLSDSPVYQGANTSFMGLYGSVCNVVYYSTTLDQGQIVTNYNLLSMQNPPIPL